MTARSSGARFSIPSSFAEIPYLPAVLLQYPAGHFFAFLRHALGVQDFCLFPKAHHPAEKQGGDRYLDGEDKMVVPIGDEHGVLAEPVDDHVGQVPVKPELDGNLISGVHLEHPAGVFRQILARELRAGETGILLQLNVADPVSSKG